MCRLRLAGGARATTRTTVTNEKGNDPDIKTAPALTFVRGNPKLASALNWVQQWQTYYYVPLMSLLDFYWRAESIQYLTVRKLKDTWIEWTMMGIHYAALLWLFQGKMQWLAFVTLARGFMTGIVVFATHYGEEHLDGGDHKMTLVEQTALTSRNITGGYIVNLLTGYISADGAPPLPDDADGAPGQGAADGTRLLQEARRGLPREHPHRVRQIQHRRAPRRLPRTGD